MTSNLNFRRWWYIYAFMGLAALMIVTAVHTGFVADLGRAVEMRVEHVGQLNAPYSGGATSLKERIAKADVIARVRLNSVSRVAERHVHYGALPTGYVSAMELNFTALEYLKGSGGDSITAIVFDAGTVFETEVAARTLGANLPAGRDTKWDGREAIIFLDEVDPGLPSTEREGRYYLGYVWTSNSLAGDADYYSIASDRDQRWLPATATNGVYLLESPETGETEGSAPTITLADLKTAIAEIDREVAMAGGSIEARFCVERKYEWERREKVRTEHGPRYVRFDDSLASGLPADTLAHDNHKNGKSAWKESGPKAQYWLEGRDAGLFDVRATRLESYTFPGYDESYLWHSGDIFTTRPLPAGEYRFYYNYRHGQYVICDAYPKSRRTSIEHFVAVFAPEGTLHELFFDPVTVGTTVGADSTNGVLKPAAFTDSNGASATVESISYEAGRVKVKVVPYSSLLRYVLDFIELDGTVSLSLYVSNSSVEVATDTLSWSVSSQTWEDGDKLMVRIREVPPFANPPRSLTATASGSDSISLSWDSVRGAAGYRVQRRESGEETWETVDASVTGTTYTVSALSCATTYEFRVGSYGDGTRYDTRTGPWSTPASETTDECSQPPTFDAASYSFKVSEDAAAGTQAGTVSATDPDEGDTLTYSIVSGNEGGKFAIDGSTGVITVSGTLDYETASSYTLTVQASDGKGGMARATVTIGVIEVVDTGAPVFGASGYAFSVIEGASVGSTVGAVSATDPNEGDTVAYSISAGNDAGKFAIDSGTGRITLAGTLDYETASSYTLTVEASDGKGGKGTATVTVSVEQASCSNGTAVASPSDNAGLVKDCLTLLALRDSLEGTVVLNWSSNVAIGNWKGVGVAGTPRRVQSLSLSDLDLDGTVPAGLGDLAHLRRLDMSENELTGGVPTSLGKLSGLELLELSENGLTGVIPSDLGGLTSLGRLSLGQNGLTGSIPPSLGRLSNLYSLSVDDNDLSGSIPGTLGSLSRLLYLSLGGNDLTGTIPSELGSLTSLQYLYLDTNDLTGGIPTQLGSLAKLEILSLYGNKLTGGIPSELGNLSKLEELMLSRNGLTGSIPSSLERLSKLVYLRLSGNRLTGCIPSGLRNVTDHDLGRLSLAYCATEA